MRSRLRPAGMRKWFQGDPSLPVMLAAAEFGVNAMYTGPIRDRTARHHPSLDPRVLREYAAEGLAMGAVKGPFASRAELGSFLQAAGVPHRHMHFNPRGVVPKPGKLGRLIDDKSFGGELSINHWVDVSATETVRYDRVQAVTSLLREARRRWPGEPLKVLKLDISAAFRHLLLRVHDWWLGCFELEGEFFVDVACPFGMVSSVFWFGVFSSAFRRAARRLGVLMAVYVDDFFMVAPERLACAHRDTISCMVRDVGFSLSAAKLAKDGAPADAVEFIGIVVDVVSWEFRVSSSRLEDTLALVRAFRRRRSASLRDFQRLAGKLLWVSQVVPRSRLYVTRILAAFAGLRLGHHRARVTASVRADLDWWLAFLPHFNGVQAIPSDVVYEDPGLFTDAADSGFGGVDLEVGCHFLGQWAASETTDALDINVRELWTVYMLVAAGCRRYARRNLVVHVDNQAACAWINTWRCGSEAGAVVLRALSLLLARHSIRLRAAYIASADNVLADALSRGDLTAFSVACPCRSRQITVPARARSLLAATTA